MLFRSNYRGDRMKSMIELAFIYETKNMKNIKIDKDLEEAKKKILTNIERMKFTKEFINEFISMYDKEQLYKIMAVMQREIQRRTRNEINNNLL